MVEVEGDGEVSEVGSMPLPGLCLLAALHQVLQAVLADRLEHAEARRTLGRCVPVHQTLVDQSLDALKRGREWQPTYGCRRLQRPAASEDGQASEDGSILCGQQRVAPADRIVDGLLA